MWRAAGLEELAAKQAGEVGHKPHILGDVAEIEVDGVEAGGTYARTGEPARANPGVHVGTH